MTCIYAPIAAYEPSSVADLMEHYRKIGKRVRSAPRRPVVTIKPHYTLTQARDWTAAAHAILEGAPDTRTDVFSSKAILLACCAAGGARLAEVRGERRFAYIIAVRQAFAFLARTQTRASLPKIGKMLGGQDHSTVVHGIKTAGRQMEAQRGRVFAVITRATSILEGKAA